MIRKYTPSHEPYFYPTKDESLLIKAAVGKNKELVVSNFEEWVDFHGFTDFRFDKRFVLPLVYDRLEEGSKRLLPLVYSNFKRLKINDQIVNQFASYHRYTTFHNRLLKNELDDILQELETDGYRYYLRKGMAYLQLYYDDYGARPTVDIDIVIDENQIEKFLASSSLKGWHSITDWTLNSFRHSLAHAITLKKKNFELDLHWRFGHRPIPKYWHEEIFKKSSARNEIVTLSNELHLIDTLIHGFRFNNVRPIRWVCDSIKILDQKIDDWDIVLRFARECEAVIPILSGLRFLRERELAGIPEELLNDLAQIDLNSPGNQYYLKIIAKKGAETNFRKAVSYATALSTNKFEVLMRLLRHYKFIWNRKNYVHLFIFILPIGVEKIFLKKMFFLRRHRNV